VDQENQMLEMQAYYERLGRE